MSFDPFYTELIQIYKNGGPNNSPGGWAQFYYGIFEKIINLKLPHNNQMDQIFFNFF
jgi:hypothetical protein